MNAKCARIKYTLHNSGVEVRSKQTNEEKSGERKKNIKRLDTGEQQRGKIYYNEYIIR